MARNTLIDDLRRAERMTTGPLEDLDLSVVPLGELAQSSDGVDRREFVSHLVECAEKLRPRDRTVWLLRVLHEMPSRGIAGHPEVRLKVGHVDVILDRCRRQIRECMGARGVDLGHLPPGTHSELWKRFRLGPLLPEDLHE